MTAKARRLQLGNIRSLQRYLQYVEGEFWKQKMLPRVVAITNKIINGESINIYELELLDRTRVQIALKGEKFCRKIRAREVPYSPEDVQKYCKLYHLWNLVVRKMSKKNQHKINQKAGKSGQHTVPDTNPTGRCKRRA